MGMYDDKGSKVKVMERGKRILADVMAKCPHCRKYWNNDIDGLEIPVDVYNNSSILIDEIFDLVHHGNNYGFGMEYWVMYVRLIDGVDTMFVTLADLG